MDEGIPLTHYIFMGMDMGMTVDLPVTTTMSMKAMPLSMAGNTMLRNTGNMLTRD